MKAIHKIRAARNEKKISEREMAEYLNIAQNTYSKIESGKSKLKYDHALLISKKLGIPINELSEDENSPIDPQNKNNDGAQQHFIQNVISHYKSEQKEHREIIDYLKSLLDRKETIIKELSEQVSKLLLLLKRKR